MPAHVIPFSLGFAACLLSMLALAPLSHKLRLMDIPSARKTHAGHIPLIGGISIFMATLVALAFATSFSTQLICFYIVAALLVLVGALDDRGGLNVYLRIAIEMVAANIMIFGAGVYVTDLGNLLGFGNLHMPFWAAYPFTLIAVFGILNAFNMIDGMDGLAGGITLIPLVLLIALAGDSTTVLGVTAPVLAGALVAYLLSNLQLLPRLPKVFLGDAGSKLLGFALVWYAISSAQPAIENTAFLEPVTALYLVGLPLMDMVTTTVRRLRKRVSPFYPDRTHIHHILQRARFSKHASLLVILTLSLAINLIGIGLSKANVPAVAQFALFFILYWLYAYNVRHAFKLTKILRNSRVGHKLLDAG